MSSVGLLRTVVTSLKFHLQVKEVETDPYYYVYGYEGTDVAAAMSTSNYATYGVLYNWPAVMTGGICPSGWHIPSDGEFTELTDFLGGESVAGGKMKDTGMQLVNGSNSSGWTGLPGGYRYSGGFTTMETTGTGGLLQSPVPTHGDVTELHYEDLSIRDYHKNYGFSARCVRD